MAEINRLPTDDFSSENVSLRVIKGRVTKKELLNNAAVNFLSLLAGMFCFYFLFGSARLHVSFEQYPATANQQRLLTNEEIYKEALVKQALYKQALVGQTNFKRSWLDYYKAEVNRIVRELEIKVKNEKQIRASCNQNIANYEDEPVYDAKVAELLKQFYKNKNANSIADIGCGKCEYVEELRKDSINAIGFVPNNQNKPNYIRSMNFITRINPTEKFDVVMSINVGEHVFLEYEAEYLDNVANHGSKWLIVSWSRIGTEGIMHVNNRDNPWTIQRFVDRGYIFSNEDTQFFRKELRNQFANSLLVFKRR